VKLTTRELTTSQTSEYHKLAQREDQITQKNYLNNLQSDKNNILKFQLKRRTFIEQTFVTGTNISSRVVQALCSSIYCAKPFMFHAQTLASCFTISQFHNCNSLICNAAHSHRATFAQHRDLYASPTHHVAHGLKPNTITHTLFFFFYSFSIFFFFFFFWLPLEEGSTQQNISIWKRS
jgi:hypothetical protein